MSHTRTKIEGACVLTILCLAGFTGTTLAAAGPTLSVTPTEGTVQTPAVIVGSGFAPGETVDLSWYTTIGNDVVVTPAPTIWPLTTVKADGMGEVRYAFKVPFDLGGPHMIEARTAANLTATTDFAITRTAEIWPASGPIGTMITLHMTGGGSRQYDNIVAVTYDNVFMGFMCANNSQGNMTLTLPAVGALGLHAIDIWPSIWWGPSDGPTPWKMPHISDGDQPTVVPKFHLEFELTEGVATLDKMLPQEHPMSVAQTPIPADALQARVKESKSPVLALSSGLLPPGGDLVIAGGGLAPGDTVELTWSTVTAKAKAKGYTNAGWNITPVTKSLATVTATSTGTFLLPMKVPYDFGGDHDIQAKVAGKSVAQTSLRIHPRFEFVGPSTVKAGEQVTLRGYGLGYEKYTAVWTLLYDNSVAGWVSAFETQGNVTWKMYAMGAPGKHFIDIHEGTGGFGYLNLHESPWPWEPAAHFNFDIAGPSPKAAGSSPVPPVESVAVPAPSVESAAAPARSLEATDAGAETNVSTLAPGVLIGVLAALAIALRRRGRQD